MLARRALGALARRASSSTNIVVADAFAVGRRARSDDATTNDVDGEHVPGGPSDVEAVEAFLRRAGVDAKHAETLGSMEMVMGIKTHNAKKKGLNVKERKALLRLKERVRAGLEST
jgi:hypothetical protein